MKIVKSPLVIERMVVLNANFKTIITRDVSSIEPDFDNYSVDMDYSVKKATNKGYRVFLKVSINQSEQEESWGYQIFAEMMFEFSFSSGKNLNESDMKNYIFNSGLLMGINSLRNYISSTTAQMLFGQYTMPSIDLGELRKAKNGKTKIS